MKINMNSKLKTDTIAICLIVAMMVMQLSLTKIFARIIPVFNYPYNPPVLCVVYVLIMLCVYALVFVPRVTDVTSESGSNRIGKKIVSIVTDYKELAIILGVLLVSIALTDVITIVRGQLRITNILTHNLDYLYAFLALPISVLLTDGKWKWTQLADTMLALSALSAALRTFVSVYYTLTGIEITIISKESAGPYWFRNNRLRVTAPCFICLCIALAVYMFMYSKSVIKKIIYVVEVAIILGYGYFIWQARAGLVTIVAGAAIVVLFGTMTKKQFYIRWGCVGLAAIAFIACGGIQKLVKAFSMAEDAQYVMENRGHYYAYELFFGVFKDNILGNGLTEDLAIWFPNGRAMWMCDAGFMYSLVPMGITILIFYILMFARGLQVYLKYRKKTVLAVLALAFTATICVGELSMDCFFTPLAFEVPFYLGIVEYIAHKKEEI